MLIKRVPGGGQILGFILGEVALQHKIEHHEISKEDAQSERLVSALSLSSSVVREGLNDPKTVPTSASSTDPLDLARPHAQDHELQPITLNPTTGLPDQLHSPGGVQTGPAFLSEGAARLSGQAVHVLKVTLRNSSGEAIGTWYEASESGIGFYGHTEQKALLRINFEEGMSIDFRGDYAPCAYHGTSACFQSLDAAARLYGVDIEYQSPYGILYFEGDEGHIENRGQTWTVP